MVTTTYNKRYVCDRCGYAQQYELESEDEMPAGWLELYGETGNHVPIAEIHFCETCYVELVGEFIEEWDGKHYWERDDSEECHQR